NQFRLAFYTTSPEQHNIAESVMKQLQSSGKQVPQVADLPQYFKATAEHQNYQRKHADK
ncbi:MAG: peptide-methionine (S)-S-oxide reductase, partial [Candidatus Kapabacteria bacterium]|nr:peptide-methionine (S)-S-oxide reductase [Candidatus Kapabacteria bacterium]